MSKTSASVNTMDLEETLDFLDGLVAILGAFHAGAPGHDQRSQLVIALLDRDSHGNYWDPLRYQSMDGQGWRNVAAAVESLRERLLADYAEAAL